MCCCLTVTSFSSGALTQAIRNFAKSLEGWLNNAMNAIPQRMIQTKVDLTDFLKFPSVDASFVDGASASHAPPPTIPAFSTPRLPLLVPLRKHCVDTHL